MIEDVMRLESAASANLQAETAASARIWADYRTTLELAVRPFPDLPFGTSPQDLSFLGEYQTLQRRIADAAFLGDVDLPEADGGLTGGDESEAESQLIEVVPADAFETLQRVRFVPFSLLAAALARPEAMLEMGSRSFEEFVAELVSHLGLENVILTPPRADGGRDVVGTKVVLGCSLILAFECKRYSPNRPVGIAYARALLGTVTHDESRADRGILVASSRFTAPARHFIVSSPKLEGVDFAGLVNWLWEYSGRTPS